MTESGSVQPGVVDRLTALLSERGWTVNRLAGEMGEYQSTLSRQVKNKSLSVDVLVGAARVLGVSVEWLLFGTEKPAPIAGERVNTEPIGDAERLDLLRMLAGVQAAVAGGGTASTPTQAEMAKLERRATSLGETIAPVEDTERRNHGAG